MLFNQFCLYLLVFSPLLASPPMSETKMHALYLMQKNQVEESIQKYREYSENTGRHDFEILQQMGFLMMQKGIQSSDPQTFLMTLLGAGLSGSASALEILEKGLSHPDPQIQLMSIHFLSQFDDDKSSDLLNRAMSSEFLAIRMEAVFNLALKKHPHVVGHLESLMVRLPPAFKPYFPSFFAMIGTNDAIAALRRLSEDSDPQVRIESILQIARSGRDDFLPFLRKRLSHSHIAEVEATIFAIGAFKDSLSFPKLIKLADSPTETIRLAANLALLHMGSRAGVSEIIDLARVKHLFAISALGNIPEGNEVLDHLLYSSDLNVRINAAVSLLRQRDPKCLPVLAEILILDERDLAFQPMTSVGRTLSAIKAIPSAELRMNDPTVDLSYSFTLREQLLREAIQLPEESFLMLAKIIMNRQQNDLVPTLISLFENLRTPGAIALLKEGTKKLGSPLIRDYCYLSLYRMKEDGPYEDYINNWVVQQKDADLIKLRPIPPLKYRMDQSDYTLSPEETSRLLIETFLTIANRRNEKSIAFLLETIQFGNPQNRFALMGLLMKATE
jgi:HEAT repeat protein